jgi:hypothetical protein
MTRVGAAGKAAIEWLGVRVIDASDAGWGIINHDLFLSNADVQRVMHRSIDARPHELGFWIPAGRDVAFGDFVWVLPLPGLSPGFPSFPAGFREHFLGARLNSAEVT